jgi:hypothetical protein
MNVLKKLQNPFALAGQGFVLGGILFFATHSSSLEASPTSQLAAAATASAIEAGR